MADHPFWFLLTMACVVWYSTITIYVAIRGGYDIKRMLAKLGADADKEDEEGRGEFQRELISR